MIEKEFLIRFLKHSEKMISDKHDESRGDFLIRMGNISLIKSLIDFIEAGNLDSKANTYTGHTDYMEV